MRAFAAMYGKGDLHSIESGIAEGALLGSGFGISLGRAFFGESMFSREDHTSKLAAYALHGHLENWGYPASDVQTPSPTMLDMSFRMVPRAEFIGFLAENAYAWGKARRRSIEVHLEEVSDWQAGGMASSPTPAPRQSDQRAPAVGQPRAMRT